MKQEATCPICLEYLKDPRNLDCGHNFCAGCITSYCEKWKKCGEGLNCPTCKAPIQKYNPRPNWQLANLVEKIQVMSVSLQEESTCAAHKEKLHLFCKEDEELLCWKCKNSPQHERHVVLLKEEAAEKYKDLIRDRLEILKRERERILTYEENTERESQDLLKEIQTEKELTIIQFRNLHLFLEQHEKRLLAQAEDLEKELAKERDEYLAKLSRKLSALERAIQEMEEKNSGPACELLQDVRSTLQRCEKAQILGTEAFAPELKWRIWDYCNRDPFVPGMEQLFQNSLLPGRGMQKENVTLDPETAQSKLIRSANHKHVSCRDIVQDQLINPKKSPECYSVLGCNGFTTDGHFWEVVVDSNEAWAVGVAIEPVKTKGTFQIHPKDGIWAVGFYEGEYRAFAASGCPRLSVGGTLEKIRVSLNYSDGRVAFYDADRHVLLHSFTQVFFCGHSVFPFFNVSGKARLWISP